jgi:predicted DsbA family dithiol-disulfide isomerase
MQVQVFSDVACPWCYLGVNRLERAAGLFAMRTGQPVDLLLRAFQLDPKAPAEPRPLLDALAEKYGSGARVEQATARLAEHFAADGLPLDLDAAVQANTLDAHRLLTWAESVGGAPTQLALAGELWRAHFAEGADIADATTLATRAAVVGLDVTAAEQLLASDALTAEVALQQQTAMELGIRSVPTVVLERTYVVTGAQTQATYEQVLGEVRRARAAG